MLALLPHVLFTHTEHSVDTAYTGVHQCVVRKSFTSKHLHNKNLLFKVRHDPTHYGQGRTEGKYSTLEFIYAWGVSASPGAKHLHFTLEVGHVPTPYVQSHYNLEWKRVCTSIHYAPLST